LQRFQFVIYTPNLTHYQLMSYSTEDEFPVPSLLTSGSYLLYVSGTVDWQGSIL
jgi:hypothetical protein